MSGLKLELSQKELRRLLDMAYIGNWILNSYRSDDRISDYEDVLERLFEAAAQLGMRELYKVENGRILPSDAFEDGGIQSAIAEYEDVCFYDILADNLARRDLELEGKTAVDSSELLGRIEEYADEFDENGLLNLKVQK